MKRFGAVLVVSLFVLALGSNSPFDLAGAADVVTRTAKVKSAGVAFEYPRSWVVFVLSKRDIEKQRKRFEKANPKIATAYVRQAAEESAKATEFSAGDLEARLAGDPVSNMSVTLLTGFPPTLDRFTEDMTAIYEKSGGTVLGTSRVSVGGKESYRVDVRIPLAAPSGTVITMRFGQLAIPRGTGGVVVSIGGPDDDTRVRLFDDVLASVRLI